VDAISLLKQDHTRLRKILKQLENSSDNNGDRRTELLRQIEGAVQTHTTIEEEIFYPAFHESARSKSDDKLYYEAIEEHHVIDLVMPEIQDTDVESEQFAAKAKVLKDLIEHHIEEEEKMMFPKARKLMGTEELREIGQQLQNRKNRLTRGLSIRRAIRRAA
jgi:hemerythrin-like domain-containing protein